MTETLTSDFIVPATHPALAGHFPGRPIVPAVLILDLVLAELRKREPFVLQAIPAVKFLSPVLPGERIELRLRFEATQTARVRVSFEGVRNTSPVFEGSFLLDAEPA